MAKQSPAKPRAFPSQERIVAAARRLFIAHGLAGVNMDHIAEEAGVARQTLYNRFGNKEAVFLAAIDAHWAGLADTLATDLDPSLPAEQVLRNVANDVVQFISTAEQVAMTRMVIAESRHMPELSRTFYERGKAPLLDAFVTYATDAAAGGELRCSHPELAARQFLGMIQEVLFWPQVMGLAPDTIEPKLVIESAINVWQLAYQRT